ncbi:type IX secretion system membrane protein PorP/SprF [Ancylomarina euxinus]|uniref:Type IX secretion system membrane protein PorP/SprF n=1 Tax=Ancylomarina euxinus TaxID=2283627 RepID=A0A425XZG6_9BACT|nr:type IX secretion system membrane protein PorP/SprF [Ancylomarina euxinus]MCZ4695497.1 type IX secretion system membrane protein PorP/SprF [Ancylomarina euxinus]MUP15685.1 type IX secretion system membrane protein PorP/SprF [Ancylomarina euxinus]RRG20678.1 type IX secretion system membrane protein PorP/SprF [Ancylomarina euxinus]
MRRIFFIILAVGISIVSKAQQDPQFSQNMYNLLTFNPAFAGVGEEMTGSIINRQQWIGFDDAPVSTAFNGNIPLKIGSRMHGLGLTVMSDKLGIENKTNIKFQYAYQFKIFKGILNAGLSVGLQNNALKGEWEALDDGDVLLNGGSIDASKMVFDAGVGFYYRSKSLYLGASTTHINKPNVAYNESLGTYLYRHCYFMGGYKHALNYQIDIIPSFFVKTDAISTQYDINTNVVYNKKYRGGVSYRVDDAFVFLVGILLKNGLDIGVAYDVSVSDIKKPSLEFMLAYHFTPSLIKRKQKYKSIRFL